MRTKMNRLDIGLIAPLLIALLAVPCDVRSAPGETPRRAVVAVGGVACPFCVYGLEKHLRAVPGVAGARVELGEAKAIVDVRPGADVSEAAIERAVRDAGFTPGRIEWVPAQGGESP